MITDVCACLSIGSGYKVSELASLSEGETLMIGGKQVEVMGIISAEDFAKGSCFQEVQIEKEVPVTKSAGVPPRRFASKPFCPPTQVGRAQQPETKPEEGQICQPRHDPLAQGTQFEIRNSTSRIRSYAG